MDIGIEFGMDHTDLKVIGVNHREDPNDCFTEMLSSWLNSKGPTWAAVVTALNARAVGFEQLATNVEQALRLNTSVANENSTSLTTVKQSAEDKGKSDDGFSLDQKQDDSESPFQCPCGQLCTLESYLDEGCSKSCDSYPYLDFSELSEDDREDLIQKLNEDTEQITIKFADLCNDFSDSLKERGKTASELVRTVVSINKSLREELVKETKIDTVFSVLHKQLSFFNYETLAYIVERLGDARDKERLDNYREHFKKFCKRRIFEVMPHIYGSSQKIHRRKKFVVLASELELDATLGTAKAAQRKIASLLRIKASHLQLHRIDEGSVILVFSLPNFIAQELFPLNPDRIRELKAEGFTFLIPNELTAIEPKLQQVL